jgi:hypothetical protein
MRFFNAMSMASPGLFECHAAALPQIEFVHGKPAEVALGIANVS